MKKILFTLLFTFISVTLQAQTTTVRVTYYNINGKTAYGVKTHRGICAVSRDLEKMGFKLGEKVKVEGYGIFQILDRTSSRLKKTVDIWIPKGQKIKNGKNVKITLVYDND